MKLKSIKNYKPDINCHVCGRKLTRNIIRQTEVCTNPSCQVKDVIFNIFSPPEKG